MAPSRLTGYWARVEGAPPTRKVYVAQIDAAAKGGRKPVKPLFQVAEVASAGLPT
ncbi:hypothetical protein J7I98_28875 [Streptomyces sp. ISL-98]|uniref:hypothetical protein n=1 Tax=Streptomyces sp. ISL-98 TaxID=2819192 RepID=UPI001BE6DE0E|nr:hypothetical protein [Streptomyces sp. ISL-98]MBT2509811.1 hypothetical protein [Streptomyces sp. ISL-98]